MADFYPLPASYDEMAPEVQISELMGFALYLSKQKINQTSFGGADGAWMEQMHRELFRLQRLLLELAQDCPAHDTETLDYIMKLGSQIIGMSSTVGLMSGGYTAKSA